VSTTDDDVRRVLVVFGTRPEAIKLAPVVAALRASARLEPVVAVTGQHREILDQVLRLFDIIPKHDLDIIQPGQTLAQITTRALTGLVPLIEAERPDLVVVQGDTTTTFAASLAAFYAGVEVAHVEAGLRSGDLHAPWPEELNRRLTTQLSALHLAPTATARRALLAEGVDPARVVVTGNTVIDALRWVVGLAAPLPADLAAPLAAPDRRLLLVTAHRRESWGEGMRAIGEALAGIATAEPELLVVLPLHPNPVVRQAVLPPLEGLANVLVTEPLPYPAFARLLDRATVVLTDSGGVQEEAPSLGKPVLVMRDTTERPEAVTAGTARLVGSDRDMIVAEVLRLLRDEAAHRAMATAVNPYGDGRAAPRVEAAIARHLGLGGTVEEFRSS
jgi:UDP-N-acetylglucosamine 2-epimerase (non-hydrolysing)